MKSTNAKPRFFPTQAAFREWLKTHHKTGSELWVGFYKKDSGRSSITWPESVDEALCFGWIDGIRKRVDNLSYMIRFTPRRKGSVWSAINVKRVSVLTSERRMRAAGRDAFAARREDKSGIYSYEQRHRPMEGAYRNLLEKNKKAWSFFRSQPAWYQKQVAWWVVSAKKEETRQKRLQKLIENCVRGKRL
ncbi:MAG TPA: YdeI/OmpD-associated family protein [Chthoniobacterales bacterium]